MLFFLSQYKDLLSPLNIFQYITFRSGGAFLTAFLLALLLGRPFIDLLKRLRVQPATREYVPPAHLAKSGTPTMGGLLILFAMGSATLLWARWDNRYIWVTLLTAAALGLLGFADDYRKWVLRHPARGLSERVKMAVQFLVALAVATYFYFDPPNAAFGPRVHVPYFKDAHLYLGGFYITFALVVIIGACNAVNLTDGLDGLAPGLVVINAIAFGVFAYLAGHARLSGYLRLVPVPGAGELAVYLAAMAGACLGFLWHNAHPAAVFMGDTGSLPLGGTIGVAALCIRQELILVVVGGIFVAEALSVLLQIGSVRLRKGKRIFLMAPLHHHFEVLGVPETKVTIRFWIVGVVLALVALTSLKIR